MMGEALLVRRGGNGPELPSGVEDVVFATATASNSFKMAIPFEYTSWQEIGIWTMDWASNKFPLGDSSDFLLFNANSRFSKPVYLGNKATTAAYTTSSDAIVTISSGTMTINLQPIWSSTGLSFRTSDVTGYRIVVLV